MDIVLKAIAGVFGIIVLIVVIGLIMAWPVMMLWNGCLVDAVSGVKEIGWLQAWGILILCGSLFKSSASVSK